MRCLAPLDLREPKRQSGANEYELELPEDFLEPEFPEDRLEFLERLFLFQLRVAVLVSRFALRPFSRS